MADQWIIIPYVPTGTEHGMGTVYNPADYAGTPVSSPSSSGMLSQSTGWANASWQAGIGFTSPTRVFSPFVFRPGQAGAKVLIHFDEFGEYETGLG